MCKTNSVFVPREAPVRVGAVLPVTMKEQEYEKEARLRQSSTGAATEVAVTYFGTNGDRPNARITVERKGASYTIEQSIDPVYGLEIGDELWIAYDGRRGEAIILNYASD